MGLSAKRLPRPLIFSDLVTLCLWQANCSILRYISSFLGKIKFTSLDAWKTWLLSERMSSINTNKVLIKWDDNEQYLQWPSISKQSLLSQNTNTIIQVIVFAEWPLWKLEPPCKYFSRTGFGSPPGYWTGELDSIYGTLLSTSHFSHYLLYRNFNFSAKHGGKNFLPYFLNIFSSFMLQHFSVLKLQVRAVEQASSPVKAYLELMS